MADVHIDANLFYKRLAILQKTLEDESIPQGLVIVGARNDDNTYKKSTVLQNWLLGYEFVHTAIYVSPTRCIFITSEGKAKYLKGLTNKPDTVELWTRTKDPERNKQLFVNLIADMKKVGEEYGTVLKDKYDGKFVEEWTDASKDSGFKVVDLALTLSKAMEIKDSEEFENTKIASNASVAMMDTFVNDMTAIVDEDKRVTNSQLTDQIEDKIDNNKWYLKTKLGKSLLQPIKGFDPEF